MNNDTEVLNTVEEREIFGDREFPSWLIQQQVSLACTTDRTSRLMLIGTQPLSQSTFESHPRNRF